MKTISVDGAMNNLDELVSEVNRNGKPIRIIDEKDNNVVLLSENVWNSLNATTYINSIPGLADSILSEGLSSLNECIPESKVTW